MVNWGIVFLVVLTIIIAVVVIGVLIGTAIARSEQGGNTTITSGCTADISSLVQIPNTLETCDQQGSPTSLYYIGNISSFDFVVAPWPSSPLDVCVDYCSSFDNNTCTGPNFNGKTAQQNFDACMAQLTPTTCQGTLPIAAKGAIIYYAHVPTCRSCSNCNNE